MTGKIALTGMMGAGKSVIARKLGDALALPIIDLDEEIVRLEGRTIPDIFDEEGETRFREIESETLRNVCRSFSGVLSTGGGVILLECNRRGLADWGRIVYLRASAPILASRLAGGGVEERPLLDGERDPEERLASILAKRKPHYEEATLIVDTDLLTPDEVCREIIARLSP